MKREFKNSEKSKTNVYFALFFFWFSLLIILYGFLGNLFGLMVGLTAGKITTDNLINLLWLTFAIFIVLTGPLQIVNQYSHVRVTEEGLYVRVYKFRYFWKLIKWDEVLEVKLSPLLDRWKGIQWVISVKNLTYWHWALSMQLRCGPQPGIIVTSDMVDGDKLIKIVKEKIKK